MGAGTSDYSRYARKLVLEEQEVIFGLRGQVATGIIEAFVCTNCGYFEEYLRDPQKVDWTKVQGFRWCTPPEQHE